MAILRFDGEERELPDNTRILDTAEDLGMPFGCTDGLCGTCICTVVQGMENLSPKNDKEDDMDLAENQRLACQCVIKSGVVELAID